MTHRKVTDVMNADVVSVRTDTSFHDIARLLAKHGISAVPVVNEVDGVVDVVDQLSYSIDDTESADARYYRPLL